MNKKQLNIMQINKSSCSSKLTKVILRKNTYKKI